MATETLGRRLRRLRLARGLSQRDLSEPGVSYAYISRLEAGTRQASVKALRKIAPKLGVSVKYLETGVPDDVELALALLGIDPDDLTKEERKRIEAAPRLAARHAATSAVYRVARDRGVDVPEALLREAVLASTAGRRARRREEAVA